MKNTLAKMNNNELLSSHCLPDENYCGYIKFNLFKMKRQLSVAQQQQTNKRKSCTKKHKQLTTKASHTFKEVTWLLHLSISFFVLANKLTVSMFLEKIAYKYMIYDKSLSKFILS